ncbi:pre-mRNA processing factor 3-domain-containing protein [Aspergillus pseudonomiae]|uniref:U4/U6 small nuclear ribonucleoprotein n=2 Tax=Aspergillus subgen. Circumdati TaxID=2720871 RepID=A0A0L1IYU3_ASPN3|nr:U4/U6 small nuclear ribonucleoprotein [Aspergillus nomiae NRRL 13137]XP_031939232.1 pre-mRNA processing factor 3-domain-containing protein [Aspergillus pseudonomiae]KAB8265269.1 pre-mRNA processing factor 3-domain-containing protein [Aspergillus pseudonomiae]KAE8401913.1 pre-mRNA processing factor 3-domain-containing protein [Aspergillus pseudonomiae]KNG84672.1 U4/U6 small nuclear ribonucleoprotein [Aspergillus nomiae NRRL 13137]
MADLSGNMLKRPHPEDEDNNTQKRSRSSNGSPLPGQGAPASGKPDIERMVAEARAKAEAVRARLQAARGGSTPSAAPSPSPTPPAASPAMSRLEQMKARVAAATGRANVVAQQRPAEPSPTPQPPPLEEDDGSSRGRGGLDVGLHPALLSDTVEFRSAKGRQSTQSKNRRTESPATSGKPDRAGLDLSGPSLEEIRNNPYYDPSLGPKATIAKPRQSRQLIFNQKGKYIQQGAALRRQAQLEAMKKRIAERARQAGIDEDLDVEKAFLVPAPPAIEWWDEGLVDGEDYSGIEDEQNLKIDTPDTIVTQYVQHPVLLDPPQDKHMAEQKPMYLTPKEQAKIRRQRRMADLKEQQAKIRLGLEPAPPPKVKKSNLMRVLGEQAVKDPTAVEARVTREIAERRTKHEEANEERKLTKEERRDKLARQQEKDAEKGILMSVYRIDSLANGRNRFKISRNAEQNALTGVCVMHPKFNLVIVEGGSHSINNYRKLMLNRIDWTENAGPNAVREGNREAQVSWLAAEDEQTGDLKDLSSNTCSLLWEGQVKARAFRKWLGARVCETDSQAKDVLARAKLENFWALGKSAKQSESWS